MKKISPHLIIFLFLMSISFAKSTFNPVTVGFGDQRWCRLFGDCTLNSLTVISYINATHYNSTNVTGDINAYAIMLNGTPIQDIFVDEVGDTMTGDLLMSNSNAVGFNNIGENISSPSAGYLDINSRGFVNIVFDTNNNGADTADHFTIYDARQVADSKIFSIAKSGDSVLRNNLQVESLAVLKNLTAGNITALGILTLSPNANLYVDGDEVRFDRLGTDFMNFDGSTGIVGNYAYSLLYLRGQQVYLDGTSNFIVDMTAADPTVSTDGNEINFGNNLDVNGNVSVQSYLDITNGSWKRYLHTDTDGDFNFLDNDLNIDLVLEEDGDLDVVNDLYVDGGNNYYTSATHTNTFGSGVGLSTLQFTGDGTSGAPSYVQFNNENVAANQFKIQLTDNKQTLLDGTYNLTIQTTYGNFDFLALSKGKTMTIRAYAGDVNFGNVQNGLLGIPSFINFHNATTRYLNYTGNPPVLFPNVLWSMEYAANPLKLDWKNRHNQTTFTLHQNQTIEAHDDMVIHNNLSVYGNIFNEVPHMYGLATVTHTVPVIDTWYNITFNDTLGVVEDFDFMYNTTIIIGEPGDYIIDFGVSVADASAAPTSIVGIRIAKNDEELEGSYKEFFPSKQNAQQWLDMSIYTEGLNVGDRLNMQYIASDTDVTISTLGTYAATPFVAYGYIIKEHD